MSEKMARQQRQKDRVEHHNARIDMIAWLVLNIIPGAEKDEKIAFGLKLNQLDDEQLLQFYEEQLLRTSPLRNMISGKAVEVSHE